jgi:deazaflavin-dependent oxidoreductase (nitroreductase family)
LAGFDAAAHASTAIGSFILAAIAPHGYTDMSARMRRLMVVQNRVINRLVRGLFSVGLAPPTYALLETTGRRTGLPRQVPVANGLDGDTFWLIAGLGEQAQYMRNINANQRVRVKARPARLRDGLRMQWRSGTARSIPEDDARERHRRLGRGRPGYRLDGILLRRLAADGPGMLTVRIDLDPSSPQAANGRST